jgi:Vitamin B12 dependent methionine synthase, activation domain
MREFKHSQDQQPHLSSGVVRFSPDAITTTPQQVCRYAGGMGYKMNRDTANLVSKTLERAGQLITPALVYAIHPVSELLADGTLVLKNRVSMVLPPHEKDFHIRHVAAVVCTLGKALEITGRHLSDQGEFLESLFLDAAGVALIEALAQRAYELISDKAKKEKLYIGCRFAPGYTGMPMSSQTLLFDLVDGAAIGVNLNKRLVMTPNKSLSFFLRLTAQKTRLRDVYKCKICPASDCRFRMSRAPAASPK